MKTIHAPFDGAGVQIDRAKARVELLTSVESEQEAAGVDARRVVIRQHVVRRPELGELAPLHAQHGGAGLVGGRHEDQIADDERRRGVDRRGGSRSPRPLKEDGARCGIETHQAARA